MYKILQKRPLKKGETYHHIVRSYINSAISEFGIPSNSYTAVQTDNGPHQVRRYNLEGPLRAVLWLFIMWFFQFDAGNVHLLECTDDIDIVDINPRC